ncbi:hypothetical protein BH10BAC6_BH10BAC6_08900 [soil metagenome]
MKNTITTIVFLACATVAMAQKSSTPNSETPQQRSAGKDATPKTTVESPDEAPVARKAISWWSLGVHGGMNVSMHSAAFSGLPGVPSCCPEFSSGSGGGFYGGLETGFPISPAVTMLARLGYNSNSGTFEATEPTTVRINNTAVNTTFKHTLTTTVSGVMLEPAAEWRVAGGLGLVGGVRLGLLMSATYDQKESFTDTSIPYEYLTTNSATNNASSGDITQLKTLQFGLLLGARYHLPLNTESTFELVPEAYYAPMFTQNVTGIDWSTSSIRLGLGVLYKFMIYPADSNPLAPKQ